MTDDRAPDPGEVSPEVAERLSQRFKPSWEVDDDSAAASAGASLDRRESPDSAADAVPEPPVADARRADSTPSSIVAAPAPPAAQPNRVALAAGARAHPKHRQTIVGIAPPAAIPQMPGREEAQVFAVAAPPTVPSAPAQVTPPLPSVVLASETHDTPARSSTGPSVASSRGALAAALPGPPAHAAFHEEDELDAAAFKRGRRVPLAIAAAVLVAAAVGILVASSGSTPDAAKIGPVAPAIAAAAPSAAPPLAPAPAATIEPQPVVAAPSATAAATASPPAARANILRDPAKAGSAAEGARSREATTSRAPATSPSAPTAPKPATRRTPAASAPRTTGGGIVRDVPF